MVRSIKELVSNDTRCSCNDLSLVGMISKVMKLVFKVRKVKTIIRMAIIVNAMVSNVTRGNARISIFRRVVWLAE